MSTHTARVRASHLQRPVAEEDALLVHAQIHGRRSNAERRGAAELVDDEADGSIARLSVGLAQFLLDVRRQGVLHQLDQRRALRRGGDWCRRLHRHTATHLSLHNIRGGDDHAVANALFVVDGLRQARSVPTAAGNSYLIHGELRVTQAHAHARALSVENVDVPPDLMRAEVARRAAAGASGRHTSSRRCVHCDSSLSTWMGEKLTARRMCTGCQPQSARHGVAPDVFRRVTWSSELAACATAHDEMRVPSVPVTHLPLGRRGHGE